MKNFQASYPNLRLRRMRSDAFSRMLRRETELSPQHLIYPVFVHDHKETTDIKSMPGEKRHSLDSLVRTAELSLERGVRALALFPSIDKTHKSLDARAAYDPKGLVPQAIEQVKKRFKEMTLITDVALDPYTSHGQDGLLDANGTILNDETVTILKQQALMQVAAGADIVAPSDMMDGRVGAIRKSLDENGFPQAKILAYAAKYASALYGPFRDAVGSATQLGNADKKTYQMDPANSEESLWEVALDIQEGADMVMVKPASYYLDVIAKIRETFHMPTLAYQVSGEFSMIKAAAQAGWLDEKKCALESLLSIRRAGAHGILTYFALQAAQWLREGDWDAR